MAFEIKNPGLATTVQDQGRSGHYNVGIPQSGSMDQYSAELGNALVGNTVKEAVLECTYLGPVLMTDQDAVIAVAGAPVEVKVNGESRPEWTRLQLNAGDELSFGVIQGGTRYYIAVQGGIDVPEVLGSRSTYSLGAIGGFKGRKLQAGDLVPVGSPLDNGKLPEADTVPEEFRPVYAKEQAVRIVLGLYDHRLTDEGLDNLLNGEWNLTPVADRMGLRYSGPGVKWKERKQPFGAGSDPSNIVDAGYAVGSIQIPGGTQPIILHRDAVSGGGYAMVGTVISADMDLVARAAPGTSTRFVAVSQEEALVARRELAERRKNARAALGVGS
ncbi:biotin-dependent carboxyltransferase family protein [Pseudarthrobacter sp. HLT3-5]|uniref:5-oxoprolinase subunit C family protein n=1 Tax=Pseudarthrobacter cellobiosi TaxID=2953654 RepID=UPI00208F4F93|nr:biotin-dependent carboxyltransferase family protein [Pseudarthrobacter sp. HLT3-5]MCO4273271.1 biotin-dependent carboxyltransferase family protein [Pseudarthrobacter sp. HLT3-5]